jgi:hypothetical protein
MTKITNVISKVQVGVRVGDLLRQGVDAAGRFNHQNVLSKLPVLMQTVHDDTHQTFKASVLTDADTPEEDLTQADLLPAGAVVSQAPPAGARAAQRTAVNVTLSLGPQVAWFPRWSARTWVMRRQSCERPDWFWSPPEWREHQGS